MHKHQSSSKSGKRWRRRNANLLLPESASNYIFGIPRALGEGTETFALEYLFKEYLSKYNDESVCPAIERRQAAIDKWLTVEDQNAVVNHILEHRDNGYNLLPRVTNSQFLKFARKLTSDILGPLRDEVVLGSFSGGASTSRRRTEGHPAFKFAEQADVTSTAIKFVDLVYRLSPMLRQFGTFDYLREVEGAELFTVPKKTDIDRCACKEPDFNMFLQKGVGRHIRRRLQRFGINLNDQSINRRLAQVGAANGSLATLDLSSASDTITIEAVRSLLPYEWFEYLNDIRSHFVTVDGETNRTEMFSSMGNGFTFELESLLFYVLSRTSLYFEGIPGVVSVYGDDIIIPTDGYDAVSWVLGTFGFTVNPDKSFHKGPFRESCGGHYHSTTDVTPFYLKRKATHLTDVIRVANQLRRWAMADPIRQYIVPSTYKVWSKLAAMVPEDLWGGSDFDVDTQLVCPRFPTKRLIREAKPKDIPEDGSYIHWHNTNWRRSSEPDDSGFEAVDALNKRCRKAKVAFGAPFVGDWFYEELITTSEPE
jgi:hypothetical protein